MRHPLTLAIVSSLTAISFLWVLSLSHPDYHHKPEHLAARPAFHAYYNSLPGFAPQATSQMGFHPKKDALEILKESRNSKSSFFIRTTRRFSPLMAGSSPVIAIKGDDSPITGQSENGWIANHQWEVDPFWDPNKDRPTNNWAKQLQVSDIQKPFFLFQKALEDQLLQFHRQNQLANDLPPMPSKRDDSPRSVRNPIIPKNDYCYLIGFINQEKESGFEVGSAGDGQLENSLDHLNSVINNVGFRKRSMASNSVLPIGFTKRAEAKSNAFSDLEPGQSWKAWSPTLDVGQWIDGEWVQDQAGNIGEFCESNFSEWTGRLEDHLLWSATFEEIYESVFVPGNLESIRPLFFDPSDCCEHPNFQTVDPLASNKPVRHPGSKFLDLFGGLDPVAVWNQSDLAGRTAMDDLRAVNGQILNTVRIASTGLDFEKNAGVEIPETSILPLDSNLAGFQAGEFEPLATLPSLKQVESTIPNTERLIWMELAWNENQMFFQQKHRQVDPSLVSSLVNNSPKWVAFGQRWITEYRENWKFGGFFDSVQNRTKDRVVLKQEQGVRR